MTPICAHVEPPAPYIQPHSLLPAVNLIVCSLRSTLTLTLTLRRLLRTLTLTPTLFLTLTLTPTLTRVRSPDRRSKTALTLTLNGQVSPIAKPLIDRFHLCIVYR